MRNLLILDRFINLTKNKVFNLWLTARDYSFYCYNVGNAPSNIKRCSAILKNDNAFTVREISITNNVLSRNISVSVCCAKSKDKFKEKKKPKSAKIDLRELSEIYDVDHFTQQMNQAVENMKMEFVKNLTVRSTTGALEQIPVKVDGKEYQLQELAQIARKPKLIVLNVAAFPTAIPEIIKAIDKSGLNINPQQDGTTLFLPIPK